MTIGELLQIYKRNHVAFLKNRVGTERRLDRYVGQLGQFKLTELKRIHVMDWFNGIAKTDGPYGANLALQQLHSVYERALDWELYEGCNPADRIKKFPKRSRERFVQSHEMPYLLASIHEELPRTETYFLTLLFTGCRRDEARTMQWSHLDLDRALWHKPTTKTGVPHTVPLPVQLVTRIRELPRINHWVFPSTANSRNRFHAGEWCVTGVEHAWRKIRKRAGLVDVRIHDLRRNGSLLARDRWSQSTGDSTDPEPQFINQYAGLCTVIDCAGSAGAGPTSRAHAGDTDSDHSA